MLPRGEKKFVNERSRDRCCTVDCEVLSRRSYGSVDIQMKPPAITLFKELLAISLIRAIKLRLREKKVFALEALLFFRR